MKTMIENQTRKDVVSLKKTAVFGAYTALLGIIVGIVFARSLFP